MLGKKMSIKATAELWNLSEYGANTERGDK